MPRDVYHFKITVPGKDYILIPEKDIYIVQVRRKGTYTWVVTFDNRFEHTGMVVMVVRDNYLFNSAFPYPRRFIGEDIEDTGVSTHIDQGIHI